jgi:signal transduction histidine kinase
MHSFLGVPMLGRNGPIGNLYFTEKLNEGQFSEEDESIAKMLAAEAAVAVENARLLTELQAMQESRERFYAMVSHEVRNALTAVHGWAELLKRSAGPEPPRPVVETVEAADYALDMVNDLLDLTRLEAAKIEPVISYAEAGEITELAAMVVEPFAKEENVTIELTGLGHTVICRTDAKRVQQILINLLRNAVRHSDEGSAVTLKTIASEAELRFAVIDEGEGISPEQQAIIFDAYMRADSKAGGGTGLGLTLSRSLARLLGGDLEVESMLGKGSTFTVTIPRNLPSGAEAEG